MRALVINLDKATERLAFQEQQLGQLGIAFRRLAAISKNTLDEKVYQKYHSTWERPLRHSEVACFLSHQQAWAAVVDENEPMLILEDDAYLAQNTPCILKSLKQLESVEYVTLEVRSRKKIVAKRPAREFCESSLIRLYQDRTGAAGYVLWPSGAKKLLERYSKGKMALADAFISSTYSLNAYQMEPAAIIQLDQCEYYGIKQPVDTKSTIAAEAKPASGEKQQRSYAFARLLGQLKLAMRQLSVTHKGHRRAIAIQQNKFIHYAE